MDMSAVGDDLAESSALENGLGLVQAIHLDLAILQPRLEVHGDEVAPWFGLR